MQSENRLFDDFVKVMNGAAGTLAGMTREAQAAMQERFREWIGGLDLVKRDEFEAGEGEGGAPRGGEEGVKGRNQGPAGKGAQPPRPKGGPRAPPRLSPTFFAPDP